MASIVEEEKNLHSKDNSYIKKENKFNEEVETNNRGKNNLCISNRKIKHKLSFYSSGEDFDRILLNAMTNATASSATLKRTIPKFLVLHYSPFKAVWDWLLTILILYTAIVIPYSITFGLHQEITQMQRNSNSHTRQHPGPKEFKSSEIPNPLSIADLLCDVAFIIDIIITTRTTFMHNGEVVTDPKLIAKHYLRGYFVIDLLASLPFDLLFHGGNDDPDVG